VLLPLHRLAPVRPNLPVRPNPAHGIWSKPALVVLPGPEVGRPRGHRVRGAGAHGGVNGGELAGAIAPAGG